MIEGKAPTLDAQLADDIGRFYDDPLGYVLYTFPWGEPGTPLEHHKGPRDWQKEALDDIAKAVKERGFDGFNPVEPIQDGWGSGHGIGKSAIVSWLILWIMDTRPFCKGVVTANTSDQLRTKTWSELSKWHNMSITKHWRTYRNTRGNMCMYNNQYPENWRVDAMTCKEENAESFAGLHAANSTPFYIFDEASAIPEKIFEVAQGGLTDGEPMFFMFGNPTRNTGFFRRIFGRMAHRWRTRKINSMDVEGTNKKLMQSWIDDYGWDSDFVRVRIRGEFPRAAVQQLIPSDTVEAARGRKLLKSTYDFAPRILGVDVAWYGDDRCVSVLRQGLASQILFNKREVNSVDYAGYIAQWIRKYAIDAVFVDAGYGSGVIDQLRKLGYGDIVFPVWFGGKSGRNDCYNKRAEMWVNLKDWLKMSCTIPDMEELQDDLTGPEYQMTLNGQIQLESKEQMKKRSLQSPDIADAYALTFAQNVQKKTDIEKAKEQYYGDTQQAKLT